MKEKKIKVVRAPESTLVADHKHLLGANAYCGCKDVCVQTD